LAARVQRAVHVGVFEFAGHQAGDGVGIFAVEGIGPGVLEGDQRGFGFGLILGAIYGESGQRNEEGSQGNQSFHVQIVTCVAKPGKRQR
jgi:hypothetical protein